MTWRPATQASVTVPSPAMTGVVGTALADARPGGETTVGADHAPAAYRAAHTPEDPLVGLFAYTATTEPSAPARPEKPVMTPRPGPETRCAALAAVPLMIDDASHDLVARWHSTRLQLPTTSTVTMAPPAAKGVPVD